ncbi:extracellular solute-binding protein [Streptomyces sp. HNM0575]|uniref:extracellular solute-binding protein n=1 Tax=Streptomyces sp. HNM0575 TaxID=2716338 RepID=UPI003217460A
MTRPAVALVLLALTAAACSGGGTGTEAEDRPVTVLGTWTAGQEDAFRALLDKSGVDYVYQGTAAQREVLLSQVKSGSPPDIAVMASPGELADYVREGELQPLDGLYEPSQYGEPWQPRVSRTRQNYMVPVKADLKSIVWYREDEPPRGGTPPAEDWCIGMGDDGASGWPGTDWIEDILLQQGHGTETYEKWAGGVQSWTSRPVADAWRTWGAMLTRERGPKDRYPAAERALSNDHRGEPGSSGLLFGGGKKPLGARGEKRAPECSLEHQGSFARTFYGRKHAADARFVRSSGLLPGGPYGKGQQQRHEVSADFAAMFTSTPASRKLMAYLASAAVQQRWVRTNEPPVHSFSANSGVDDRSYEDAVSRSISARLTDQDSVRCLDASDTMPPAVRDAFYETALRFLTRPARDPHDLLEDIQRVQDVEREKLGLGDGEKWMTDVCG